jgi:hypothetical protein
MGERLSIEKAARRIGRRCEVVMQWILSRKLQAFRVGGSDEHPRLQVDSDQLQKVKDQEEAWVPPAAPPPKRPFRRPQRGPLHPAAMHM